MKLFIKKTIYISFPLLIIAIALEILIRNIPNDYCIKKEYLDNHSHEIETLIFGNSQSYYGINPDYFTSKTFNASYVSQTLKYDFEIFQKYKSNFKNLKTIVITISSVSLWSQLENNIESWRLKNYIIYYDLNSSKSYRDYSEVLSNRISVNLKRLISYYILDESKTTSSTLGWGTDYKSEDSKDLVHTGKLAAERHSKDINTDESRSTLNDNLLILNSIIEWCNEQNIKVLFVTPPAFESYRKYLNPEQLIFFTQTILRITRNNHNCKYLNLINDTTYSSNEFYDADHLSEIGAKKLSILINDTINQWQ